MLSLYNPLFPVTIKSDSRMSPKSLFDRVFEDTWDNTSNYLFKIPSNIGIESKKNEDGSLSLSFDVPGINQEDLSIEIDKGILTVKGTRKTDISEVSLQKSYSISDQYETENISAELKNGILSLKLSKKEKIEIKKIPILIK